MTLHRNWALATGVLFFGVAAWRGWGKAWPSGWLTWIALIPGLVLLGVTGYLGGNLVYRHGLGVQSLPAPEEKGHSHGSEGHGHGEAEHDRQEPKAPLPDDSAAKAPPKPHPHDGTPHKH